MGRFEFRRELRQRSDVTRGGATATTDHLHAQIFNEVHQLHLQFHWGEPVVGHATNVFRKTSVGNAAHRERGVLGEVADVLLHLLRTGGAVEPENVDRKRLKNRHHSSDVRTDEHRSGGFHGHGHHQRPSLTGGCKRFFNALQRGLDLQHVLAGLNDEQVNIAGNQSFGLFPEGIAHRVEVDVPQGRQLGGGSHGPSHEAGPLRGAEFVGHLPGQFRRPFVEFKGLVFKAVFRENDRGGSKGVCFDHVAAHVEELTMHRFHRLGFGDGQIFVAALQLRATEILGGQIKALEAGARGPVKHQHGPFRPVEVIQEAGVGELPGCLRYHHVFRSMLSQILGKAQCEPHAIGIRVTQCS